MINSWQELPTCEGGEEITLKGFIYQAEDGRWILSNEPNLKTCCVGAKLKQDCQITLLGDFSSGISPRPVEVRGTLSICEKGFMLNFAEINQQQHFPIWTIGALTLGVVLIGFKLKRLLLP